MTGEVRANGTGSRPRAQTLPGQRLANLLVRAMLRTPGLCRLVGTRLVTLYVVGRRSRRCYAVPVAYLVQGEHLLIGTSFGWGKNLRINEPLEIRLMGKRRWTEVRTYTTEPEVIAAYAHMARVNLTFANFNNIRVGEGGEPDRHDLRRTWLGGAQAIRLTPR
jgi:hypothetical protein